MNLKLIISHLSRLYNNIITQIKWLNRKQATVVKINNLPHGNLIKLTILFQKYDI